MRRPDVGRARRRARRFARRARAIAYRSIVVPLLEREETEHALDLACRLAADRGARVVLVAPLVVERELPLDAHFRAETAELRRRLESAAAVAESYGVGVRRTIVRTRVGSLGAELAELAQDHWAELVVVGSAVQSRRGFRRAFPPEVLAILRDAPCRVLVATGPYAGRRSIPPWPGGDGRRTSWSASSARMRSSRRPTATSARPSTTRSASPPSSRSG
jgi:nucleotide-binding universal stress UspA family protein